MTSPGTWREVKDRLQAQRAALNEEIAAYPAPVTGCDAQFNHLLAQRSGINLELKRLEEASGDAAALRAFMQSSDFPPAADGDDQT